MHLSWIHTRLEHAVVHRSSPLSREVGAEAAVIAELGRRLEVGVRLLDEPCLWCWEIIDEAGDVVESSWTSAWMAFGTREDAETAGRAWLEKFGRPRAGGQRQELIESVHV